mmetsp:Transcript_70775/g.205193  ORF Transcript_70775/g.205193 Transcript_70775/m.205193 type:complete len:345 (+) Transcript_70775:344-1378(+)
MVGGPAQFFFEGLPVRVQMPIHLRLERFKLLLIAASDLEKGDLASPGVEDASDEAGSENQRLFETVKQRLRGVHHFVYGDGARFGQHIRSELALQGAGQAPAPAAVVPDGGGHVRQAGLLEYPGDLVPLARGLQSPRVAVSSQLGRQIADLGLDDPSKLDPIAGLRLHRRCGLHELRLELGRQLVVTAAFLEDKLLQLGDALLAPVGLVLQSARQLPALLQGVAQLAPLDSVGLGDRCLDAGQLLLLRIHDTLDRLDLPHKLRGDIRGALDLSALHIGERPGLPPLLVLHPGILGLQIGHRCTQLGGLHAVVFLLRRELTLGVSDLSANLLHLSLQSVTFRRQA